MKFPHGPQKVNTPAPWDELRVVESEPNTKYRVTITREFTLPELLKDTQTIGSDMFQPVEDYIIGNLVKT